MHNIDYISTETMYKPNRLKYGETDMRVSEYSTVLYISSLPHIVMKGEDMTKIWH